MLRNSQGKRVWITDAAGGFVEARKPSDIHIRPRGRGIPDWWVIAKDEDWLPPDAMSAKATGGSLLSLGLLPDNGDDGGGDIAGAAPGAGGVKVGAGGKPQGYDAHGRYTGPRGGAASLLDGSVRVYGQDGRMYAVDDGGEEGSARDESENGSEDGHDSPQLIDILLADSGSVATDAGGGLNGGNEVRGPVTGPEQEKYSPPPAPAEPHLTYSQESGVLSGPDGKPLAVGYAGRGGGQNNPGAEGIKGVGPLPRGNWKMEELKTSPWPDPAYKLTPDEDTRKRVIALGRDPDSFYVHAQARLPQDRGRDSAGCIALERPDREALASHKGRWIRVEK